MFSTPKNSAFRTIPERKALKTVFGERKQSNLSSKDRKEKRGAVCRPTSKKIGDLTGFNIPFHTFRQSLPQKRQSSEL